MAADVAAAARWRKSAAELELMRASASLAARALSRCMQLSRPGVEEHFLGATFGAALLLRHQTSPNQVSCDADSESSA